MFTYFERASNAELRLLLFEFAPGFSVAGNIQWIPDPQMGFSIKSCCNYQIFLRDVKATLEGFF